MNRSIVAAIIVAAGSGKRIGGPVRKQFLEIQHKPVLQYTLEKFEQCPDINHIIVVAPADLTDMLVIIRDKWKITKIWSVVPGGAERHDSVMNGLNALDDHVEYVAIHDGVRPFIKPDKISECIRAARKYGAAIVAVSPKDTIKGVAGGFVEKTFTRSSLVSVQTPQIFSRDVLMEAFAEAFMHQRFSTDDSALVENIGKQVFVVEGDYTNIKITSIEDIAIAEKILGLNE